jgi:hypothetical protein
VGDVFGGIAELLAVLPTRWPSTEPSRLPYPACALAPVNPAAIWVSKMLLSSVSQARRRMATSWRPAWSTISMAGSPSRAAKGVMSTPVRESMR